MYEHVQMRGECSGHLMDLNFSFEGNFSIRRFRGALRRHLIEDSFLFEGYRVFDSKQPASFIRSSVVFHVICSSWNMSRLMHVSLLITVVIQL